MQPSELVDLTAFAADAAHLNHSLVSVTNPHFLTTAQKPEKCRLNILKHSSSILLPENTNKNKLINDHKRYALPEISHNIGYQSDVILQIKIQAPRYKVGMKLNNRVWKRLIINGNSTLKELQQAIDCPTDRIKVSNLTDFDNYLSFSNFFLFENTIYSDTTGNDSIPTKIKEWANHHGIHKCTVKPMNTKLNQLSLRMNFYYFYLHQGDCSHFIMVEDIRYILINLDLKLQI
jgi:hypothetical protein